MTEDWPFVSIIVPVYNGSQTIDALLTSLSALDYPADRCEFLIVDNKSTDDTRERVQCYPVTLLEETEIQGSYAARNRGIQAAKGEILAFTDSDCVVEPNWLKQLLVNHENPRWGGFVGNTVMYPPANLIERYCAHEGMFDLSHLQRPLFQAFSMGERLCSRILALDYRSHIPLPGDLISPPTANVAYRRIVFDKIGYFDQRMTTGGDFDFAWRLQRQTGWQIAILPDAVVHHRHRSDLAGLTTKSRRNGQAYAILALKYGDDPERIAWQLMAESLLLMVLTVPSNLFRALARPLEAVGRNSDVFFLVKPVLTLLYALHSYCGRFEGAWRGRQWVRKNGR